MSDLLASTIARDLLGPVIHYYLQQLDQHIRQLDDGNTRFLFVSRAGIRIRRLYETYLRLSACRTPAGAEDFWVSRLLLSKGSYGRNPTASIEAIARELGRYQLPESVACIFAAEILHGGMAKPEAWAHLPSLSLHEFAASEDKEAKRLSGYLLDQSTLFEEYLAGVMAGADRAVLIDSGWQGTAQGLLSKHFGEYAWHGLYFGRMAFGTPIPPGLQANMVGLVFEADGYDPTRLETGLTLHRHLIENLFEPNAPSIERLARGAGGVHAPESPLVLADPADPEQDAHYFAVQQYLEQNCGAIGQAEVLKRYRAALVELSRVLRQPSAEEARALIGKQRSADYGRTTKVPILREPVDRNRRDSPEQRIKEALWTQGQIALEYPLAEARRKQRASLGEAVRVHASKPAGPSDPWAVAGRVAIITRTKDRPVLLKRAARSVALQTYPNYLWVVVNDGGEPEEVKRLIAQSGVDPRRILLCSNEESLGMEAASNIGVRAAQSEYVVIHDDDDSWAPTFLERMVDFLESGGGRKYGGAISKSLYVSESIEGDRVVEHGRRPYQDWVQTVQLSEMVNGNFFAPIAFLFRRDIYDRIGGFDEALPVLGDWDFNLKFLLQADIGVLPEVLAYYHHRDVGAGSAVYSNSVIGANNKHAEYNAIVRNQLIRKANDGGVAGLLAAIGYSISDLRGRIGSVPAPAKRSAEDPSWLRVQVEQAIGLADDRWVLSQVLAADKANRSSKQKSALVEYAEGVLAGTNNLMRRGLVEQLKAAAFGVAPPPDFDGQAYLRDNPDVAEAVKRGDFRCGFHHYYLFGCFEARKRP